MNGKVLTTDVQISDFGGAKKLSFLKVFLMDFILFRIGKCVSGTQSRYFLLENEVNHSSIAEINHHKRRLYHNYHSKYTTKSYHCTGKFITTRFSLKKKTMDVQTIL